GDNANHTYSCRSISPGRKGPKSRTFGTSEHGRYFGISPSTNTVIFVEDCLSAVKVGRVTGCYPCLGSYVPPVALKQALDRFENVGVWLDKDMAGKSTRGCFNALLRHGRTFEPIITEKDPKEYETVEIENILKKHGLSP